MHKCLKQEAFLTFIGKNPGVLEVTLPQTGLYWVSISCLQPDSPSSGLWEWGCLWLSSGSRSDLLSLVWCSAHASRARLSAKAPFDG